MADNNNNINNNNTNYVEWSRAQLSAQLKARGLKANGKNEEMVARLRADDVAKEQARVAAEDRAVREEEARLAAVNRAGPHARRRLDDQFDDHDDLGSMQDYEEEDDGRRRGLGWRQPPQGMAGVTMQQLRDMFGEEARKTINEVSGKIADAAVDRKEAALKMEAAAYWKDLTYESRSDHEYDVLKVAGRELYVLARMVDDKELAARLGKVHQGLVDRAVSIHIGENVGWAAASATFLPAGSLLKENEKRIEKAAEEARKRKREDGDWRGGSGGSRQWGGQAAAASSSATTVKRTITCYNCGAPGHVKRECPQPPKVAPASQGAPQTPSGQGGSFRAGGPPGAGGSS